MPSVSSLETQWSSSCCLPSPSLSPFPSLSSPFSMATVTPSPPLPPARPLSPCGAVEGKDPANVADSGHKSGLERAHCGAHTDTGAFNIKVTFNLQTGEEGKNKPRRRGLQIIIIWKDWKADMGRAVLNTWTNLLASVYCTYEWGLDRVRPVLAVKHLRSFAISKNGSPRFTPRTSCLFAEVVGSLRIPVHDNFLSTGKIGHCSRAIVDLGFGGKRD